MAGEGNYRQVLEMDFVFVLLFCNWNTCDFKFLNHKMTLRSLFSIKTYTNAVKQCPCDIFAPFCAT